MIFNEHLNLRGKHAIFGASKNAWLRYPQEKMIDSVRNSYRNSIGTEIHEFAASQIVLGHKQSSIKQIKDSIETFIYVKYFDEDYQDISDYAKKILKHLTDLSRESFETIKDYINDSIAFRMKVEQPLVYSEYFFGTADSISFKDNVLRIHDLKTGIGSVHIEQLMIYAAYFCLEYKIKPADIMIELRIYQNGEVLCHTPELDEIVPIMEKIISDNKLLSQYN